MIFSRTDQYDSFDQAHLQSFYDLNVGPRGHMGRSTGTLDLEAPPTEKYSQWFNESAHQMVRSLSAVMFGQFKESQRVNQ